MGDKKNILFHCLSDEGWIGGIYYIRNMIFALLQNDEVMNHLHIYILVRDRFKEEFNDLSDNTKVSIIISDHLTFDQRVIRKLKEIYYKNILRKQPQNQLLLVVNKYKIDYIYPVCYREEVYAEKGIMWIPDLQHIYYPEYFPGDKLKQRNDDYEYLARHHKKMVLSSYSVKEDYLKTYPEYARNVFVIPFVSAIKPEIIQTDKIEITKKKYNISGKYFLVSNQFWRHKNHKIVLEALSYLKRTSSIHPMVICTGKLEDARDVLYTEELKTFIEQEQLSDNFRVLGLIDREDQLQLMKGCIAVIQPSLFEGWGTVVEDAKTLGKRIIMSDIAVHMEQKNSDCVIFERNNAEQLADIMLQFWTSNSECEGQSDYDYVKQASEYGKLFYDMLTAETV